MSQLAKYSLLYIEDEVFVREMVIEYLEEFFSTVYEASNGIEALDIYQQNKPDIIITDIEMPKMNGLDFVTELRKVNKEIPILITTAYTSVEYLLRAVELHLVKYLLKPVNEEKLKEGLEQCFALLENQNKNIVKLTQRHTYDTLNETLLCDEEIIELTPYQKRFLTLLIRYQNRAVSYEEIENYIWYDKGMSEAAIRSLVHDLRKIIDKGVIKNVSKIGYRIHLYG